MLTGGASRRMGRPKAWLAVEGVPLGLRVAAALEAAGCRPVRWIGEGPPRTDPDSGDSMGLEVVPDLFPGEGPLGGVLTALRSAGDVDVVVAACDLPWLDPSDVRRVLDADLSGSARVAVATVEHQHVPLARWRADAVDEVEAAMTAGVRSWRAAFDRLGAVPVPVTARSAVDVDTVDDLDAVRRSATHREPASDQG